MPNQNIGFRLDTELLAQLDALADQMGVKRTAIITEAIQQRLGQPSGGSVEQRLADVEQRLGIVEQALGSSAKQRLTPPNKPATPPPAAPTAPASTPPPKQPAQNRREAAPKPAPVSQHPPESPRKADGGRWLTTSQAVEVSQARGGPNNVATLKRWGQRGQLDGIGLRRINREPAKDNSLASFEDLQCLG